MGPAQERPSNLDAEAHLGQALSGDLEKVRCAAGNAREKRKDRKRNRRHRRMFRAASDDFMRDVVMHMLQIDGKTQYLAILERHGNVRRLHETKPDVNVVNAMAEAF